ncbi:toll/interleukin-1 receptor domain-containing protein [Frankia sp. CiP3]|uniref:toll/interleukin-1 receptor domain-containing protein n=1 Tax=Frankia sp. CiP3 TaxID=2880971 RepID=UPI001EF45F8E|nr:toll/interleukin-1 receptor domain-containing protein [Frankia sp. CiP3]
MPDDTLTDAPKVFLSFAGADRGAAERLAMDLRQCGVDPLLDQQIQPGSDWILWINDALTHSDYYVLLWSQAARDRCWVKAEWTAALHRDLSGRRSFLFLVRLDDSPLPQLLAPRQYLDAANGWENVVRDLVTTWQRDMAVGVPVMPAPPIASEAGNPPSKMIYVRNRVLSFAIVLAVPETTTAGELVRLVRTRLALPDEETKFNGLVGIRFQYRLIIAGKPTPDDPAAALHLQDGCTVDLEVSVEPFGPTGPLAEGTTYRPGTPGTIPPATTRSLIRTAFRHLVP